MLPSVVCLAVNSCLSPSRQHRPGFPHRTGLGISCWESDRSAYGYSECQTFELWHELTNFDQIFFSSVGKTGTLAIWAFIDQREYPGGPSAYEDDMFSIPVDMLANVTLVICNWLCDIINVRCRV